MTTTQTEAFLAEIIPAQRAAEVALHNGDPEPRFRLWSHHDPVTVLGAKLTVVGWADVEPAFRQVASWFRDVEDYDFEVIAAGASGDVAYTVGYEHITTTVDGQPQTFTLRVTHAYRHEDGAWRIVHRHADFPPDPAGPVIPDPK
jgi:ketosteroid isomerase-like protein